MIDSEITMLAEEIGIKNPDRLSSITHGAWSTAYVYEQDGSKRVLRISDSQEDFQRDRYAYRRFTGRFLPIPEILDIGTTGERFYSISRYAEGDFLEKMDAVSLRNFIPNLTRTIQAIRSADISSTTGYGHWDVRGRGEYGSWREYLLDVQNDTRERPIKGWRTKLESSPIGMSVFDELYDDMSSKIRVCPEERELIHSDLINYNFIVKDNEPVAVIDWGSSIYGDGLYDLAWFKFYEPWYPQFTEVGLIEALVEDYRSSGSMRENIDERLAVYLIHIGLDSIAYNAHREDWGQARVAIDNTTLLIGSYGLSVE